MSDQDRGAYTPQNHAPLSFDARRSSSGPGPVPMTLMISGMALVVLLIAVVFFYRGGVRRPGQAPQVVGASVGLAKAPPPAQAAPADPAAGLQVYKSEAAPLSQARETPRFAPAPEQPAPRPAPGLAQSPVAQSPITQAPAAAPTPVPAPPAPTTPTVAAIKPAPKPVKTVPAPAPATTPAAAPVGGASPMVQIGAFSSAALADKGWSDVAKLMPGPMVGKTKAVQVVSKDGKTFYRTSVGGFAGKADAAKFCDALKAAGKSCIVK